MTNVHNVHLNFFYFQCCRIIIACAVLFNIRKRLGIQDPEEEEAEDQAIDDNEDEARYEDDGLAFRLHFAERYF